MARADRRDALKWAAAGAITTLAGFAAPPAIAAMPRAIKVPGGLFRLVRKITRELGPGASIVVTREWQIAFRQVPDGWVVSGEKIAAKVDAPPQLSALAAMEERRETPESFPIELDGSGLIRRSGGPLPSVDLERAAREAERVLASSGSGERALADFRGFVAQLQLSASSLITRFPQDLFFPEGTPVSESRDMVLPGGVSGHFQVDYSAEPQPGTHLLRSSKRVVTTTAGSETRRSIEDWRLRPA